MRLNKQQIFNLMANLFGLQTAVDIKENESTAYSRKKCKSCDWLDFAEWSELIGWAYADDLLPKRGE